MSIELAPKAKEGRSIYVLIPLLLLNLTLLSLQIEEPGGTLLKFRHLALGLIEDDHRKGVSRGWSTIHARVKAAAEGARAH